MLTRALSQSFVCHFTRKKRQSLLYNLPGACIHAGVIRQFQTKAEGPLVPSVKLNSYFLTLDMVPEVEAFLRKDGENLRELKSIQDARNYLTSLIDQNESATKLMTVALVLDQRFEGSLVPASAIRQLIDGLSSTSQKGDVMVVLAFIHKLVKFNSPEYRHALKACISKLEKTPPVEQDLVQVASLLYSVSFIHEEDTRQSVGVDSALQLASGLVDETFPGKLDNLQHSVRARQICQILIKLFANNRLGTNAQWNTLDECLNRYIVAAPDIDDKRELFDLVACLRRKRVKNSQVWNVVVQNLVQLMNKRQLTQIEVSEIAHKLGNMQLRSPQTYEYLVKYHLAMGHKFQKQRFEVNFRFIKAIAVNHGDTQNQQFLAQVSDYLTEYSAKERLTLGQTISCLDLFKFFVHLDNKELKLRLEKTRASLE